MKNVTILILAVAAVAVAVVLFMQRPATNSGQSQVSVTQGPAQTTVPTEAMKKESKKVQTFTVEGKNFSFLPTEIKVKQGDTVKIVFKNTGGFHDWTLDEFKAQTKQISTGESDTAEFVANKKGSFEYYCSVGNHRQMGMKGKLIVE